MTPRAESLVTPGADFYTYIHKSFRSRMFELASAAGRTDWSDPIAAQAVRSTALQLFSDLRDHAEHENRFWHPLIARVNADALRSLETEHATQEHQIAGLEALLAAAVEGDAGAGPEFYRAFNAFLGEFLLHLAEEEQGNPLLWAVYPDDELVAALRSFKVTIPIEESLRYLETMLPAMSPQERRSFYADLAGAPDTLVTAVRGVAERVLGSACGLEPREAA